MKKSALICLAVGCLVAAGLSAQPAGRGADFGAELAHMAAGPAGPTAACIDGLGLNDGQKTTLEQLRQELSAAVQPLLEQRRSYHEQIHAALEAADPDPTAIGRLVIAGHGVGEQVRTAHERFQTRFEALLTPEQLTAYRALRENGVCAPRGKRFH